MIASVSKSEIKQVKLKNSVATDDWLAVEEPLEIRLVYGAGENRKQKNISVTMRTPGNDAELATGFLFTEGLIKNGSEVSAVHYNDLDENVVIVELKETVVVDLQRLERNFYTTSSCGVCGKSSVDSVRTISGLSPMESSLQVEATFIYDLPVKLRQQQEVFESTGGLHASALFDSLGQLILLREDVGRHNALDKLIGAMVQQNKIPLTNNILLLSGRASFELIQKAVMAGITFVAAVGAPSSLAVKLAKEFDVTLIGFLRDQRFNIYNGEKRIKIQ